MSFGEFFPSPSLSRLLPALLGLALSSAHAAVSSSLAFNLGGYGRSELAASKGGDAPSHILEPAFLTMAEVGEASFGALELDFLMRAMTHWAYGEWYGGSRDLGLDHAYIAVNKGLFLLHEGQPAPFNLGLGLDMDWRLAHALPRDQGPPLRVGLLGLGLVMRLKMDFSPYVRISPALAYDGFVRPDTHADMLEGHGLRADCDIWLRAWPGRYTATLQPFFHWRTLDIRRGGKEYRDAQAKAFGVKFGFGFRP